MNGAEELLKELVEDPITFIQEESDEDGPYFYCIICGEYVDGVQWLSEAAELIKHKDSCTYLRAKKYLEGRPPFVIGPSYSDRSYDDED